ncbi:ATP-binding protein [Pseudochelatococcus sp. B33]
MTDDTRLERRFDVPARLESIALIQTEIERAAEGVLDAGKIFRLAMSVEELVTNVVTHGGAGGTAIGVTIVTDPGSLQIELSDAGMAFDPFSETPAPRLDEPVETRAVGGLGVHLVGKMVDGVSYHRIGGRNHIRLVMLRPGAPFDGSST